MDLDCLQKLAILATEFKVHVNVTKTDRIVGKKRTGFCLCICFHLWPCKTYLGDLIKLSEPHLFSCNVKKIIEPNSLVYCED